MPLSVVKRRYVKKLIPKRVLILILVVWRREVEKLPGRDGYVCRGMMDWKGV
jgi:hypothetical protein